MNFVLNIEERNLEKLIVGLDTMLSEMVDESMSVSEADSFGYFDVIEHFTGLAFVAMQTYITSVYGILQIEKSKALLLGPMLRSGYSVASLVNDAANYWKHNNEWVLDKSSQRQEKISNSFDLVGYPVGIDYPLSGVLTELSSPDFASFKAVFSKLMDWRSQVERLA